MSHATQTATVLSTGDVTPGMRRLVLGGSDIAALAPPAGALGPYVKLHLAAREGATCVRTYSIRRYDAARAELQVDILLHGPDAAGSAFAFVARPGDVVALRGPGYIPADPCAAYLLAGDHTALPAIAHIVENLPAGPAVQAFIEVPDRDAEQALAGGDATQITWLHRPAGAPSRLAEAVRAAWPRDDEGLLVWAGAEAAIARAIRTHARRVRGLPAARCQVLNYWKRGQPEGAFSYVT